MKPVLVVCLEKDEHEKALVVEAFAVEAPGRRVIIISSVEQLSEYLKHTGSYADPDSSPRPGVVVFDMDFSRAKVSQNLLGLIKKDPELRRLPVLVLSSTDVEEEVLKYYDAGVNALVIRPDSTDSWHRMVRGIEAFWFKIAQLPE